MKKTFSVLLALVIILTAIPLTGITSYAETSGDWEYFIYSDNVVAIKKYNGTATEFTIPSEIDGHVVRSILGSAFSFCTSLTSITIPDSVTSIGYQAFYGCTSLTSVTIGNSVETIERHAFENCTSLERFNVKNTNNYFSSQDGVLFKRLLINNQKELYMYPYNKQGDYSIPNDVISIGASAFDGCKGLTGITIPDNVTSIGDSAFSRCTSLTSITIPNSITVVDGFRSCSSLKEVIIGKNVSEISSSAFYDCKQLERVSFGENVCVIGAYAFYGCESLNNVVLPRGLTTIGSSAFENCSSLTSIVIPGTVEEVGNNKFEYIDSNEGSYISYDCTSIFKNCSSLKNVVLENGVKIIGKEAFFGCVSLESVTIPKSVWTIAEDSFTECGAFTVNCICNSYAFRFAIDKKIRMNTIGGHTPIELSIDQSSTCTEDGSRRCICSVCSTSYTETIPATGHSYNSKGICTKCDDWRYKANAPKLGKAVNATKGITVSWSALTGAEGYFVYRKAAGTTKWTLIASGMSNTSYTDTTAKAGTKYTYTIKAYYGGTNSKYDTTGLTVTRLANPKVKLTNDNAGVKVSWAKIAGAKGYYVYRKDASSGYKKIGTTSNLSYVDKTAKAGTKYTYTVRAYNGNDMSAYTGVTIVRLTTPSVKLANTKSGPKAKWGKVTGAKGYYVYRKTSSGSYAKIAKTTSLSYVDKTAKKNVKYYYAVRAYNGKTLSAYTNNGITCKK